MKTSPAALRIFDTFGKTTFATVSPQQQTSSGCSGKSETRQQPQSGVLFDHLIGASYQCVWNGEAERLCGLEIDEKLDFDAPLHGQFARFFAFENTACVDTGQTVRVGKAAAIAH